MQLQTSRVPPYPNPNTKVHFPKCATCAEAPSMDQCLPPRLAALTPTNELRIAVQAIGHEIYDVFLGSLINERLHRVASLEQMCIPISNVLQLRALKDQVPLIPQTMLTPGADALIAWHAWVPALACRRRQSVAT